MSEKQKQHYVPKFYLRNFSFENNQRQIGIYNLKSSTFIRKGCLKDQAYKPFLYGQDGKLEDAFGLIENLTSPKIKNIIQKEYVPQFHSVDHYTLLVFSLLLHLRNPIIPAIERSLNEQFCSLTNIPLQNIGKDSDILRSNFSYLKRYVEACWDLNFKLIRNKTNIPFISSDNPVIKYNQFLESRGISKGTTGFSCLGLQLFLPLNSKYLLLFYDNWVYKIGNRKNRIIDIIDVNEVNQLNTLQCLNCTMNLFFNEGMAYKNMDDHMKKSNHYKRDNLFVVAEYPICDKHGNILNNQNMLVASDQDIQVKLKVNSFKLTSQARAYKIENPEFQVRKRSFSEMKKYFD